MNGFWKQNVSQTCSKKSKFKSPCITGVIKIVLWRLYLENLWYRNKRNYLRKKTQNIVSMHYIWNSIAIDTTYNKGQSVIYVYYKISYRIHFNAFYSYLGLLNSFILERFIAVLRYCLC